MKSYIGTLLLTLAIFLFSIGGNSAMDRPIKQEQGRENSPESQESSNRNYIRRASARLVPKIEPKEEPYEPRMYPVFPPHPNHHLRAVKQEPEEFPPINRYYRDPAYAHVDIDLNRFPSTEAFANPHHGVHRPMPRYPIQQEPPRIQRDPAYAHLDIDLNRLPSENFANPQHGVHQPMIRYLGKK